MWGILPTTVLVPVVRRGGVPLPGPGGEVLPSQVWMGGTQCSASHPDLGQGTPLSHLDLGWSTPWTWDGVPLFPDLGWGYPPIGCTGQPPKHVNRLKLLPSLILRMQVVLDREGHGHKAIVYKSHFPATEALHSHSVVRENPADTLANKPCLLQRPSSLLFMLHDMVAARMKYWDLRTICCGCVTRCQSIGRMERSSLRDCLFTLWLPALSFMQNKCACKQRPLHHGQQGTAGGSWQGTHLVSGCMPQITIIYVKA